MEIKQLYERHSDGSFVEVNPLVSVEIKNIVGFEDGVKALLPAAIADLLKGYATVVQLNNTKTDIMNSVDNKQDKLKSGTNIKTINCNSLLGSGNIEIKGGDGSSYTLPTASSTTLGGIKVQNLFSVDSNGYLVLDVSKLISNNNIITLAKYNSLAESKQDKLTSGVNIATIDGQPIIGSNKNFTMSACNCPVVSDTINGLMTPKYKHYLDLLIDEYNKNKFIISSITTTTNTAVVGVDTEVTFNWKYSSDKYTVDSLVIKTGDTVVKTLTPTDTSATFTINITEDTKYTVVATSGDETAYGNITISAVKNTNKVYIGGIDKSYSSSNLTADIVKTIKSFDCEKGDSLKTTVVASLTQKIIMAYPTAYGTPDYKEYSFDADFSDWDNGSITIDGVNYDYHITTTIAPTDGTEITLTFKN